MSRVVKSIQSPIKNFAMSTYDILIEKGMQQGRKEALLESQREITISLIRSSDFDNLKIAAIVGVSTDFVKKLRKEVVS
jgi:helix-turn-helix protein